MATRIPLVACNVYVSAGRSKQKEILIKLLQRAQSKCEILRNQQNGGSVAVIHAFADGPYDRSSFHLAGAATHVATVASNVAVEAVEALSSFKDNKTETSDQTSRHPFVGLVDHVAVMPLETGKDLSEGLQTDGPDNRNAGWAARLIGSALSEAGVTVYYYGTADEQCTPLATVRREKTAFFKSGGLDDAGVEEKCRHMGVATVGSPPTFVENWNVRLTSRCTKKMAQSLTRVLRERDGGLAGVEALTLPYSKGRYEVACNLTLPDVGSANAIQRAVNKWAASQGDDDSIGHLVEQSYRVGTTAEQCTDMLSHPDAQATADKDVMERFKAYFDID